MISTKAALRIAHFIFKLVCRRLLEISSLSLLISTLSLIYLSCLQLSLLLPLPLPFFALPIPTAACLGLKYVPVLYVDGFVVGVSLRIKQGRTTLGSYFSTSARSLPLHCSSIIIAHRYYHHSVLLRTRGRGRYPQARINKKIRSLLWLIETNTLSFSFPGLKILFLYIYSICG